MNEVLVFFSQVDILMGWEPVRLIGSGSNGKVYHIRHTATGTEAALKWIHIDRRVDNVLSRFSFEKAQAMLTGEIATLKELNNTNGIVPIQESRCISPDGSSMDAFIRMELLEPLLSKLNAQTVTVAQTERLVVDVSAALEACHAKNIIHGDIKPENILCGKDGFKLGDFGVALDMLHHNRRNPQGTQYFQPPEYREGEPVSVQGDLYSFGMMLYVIFNNGMLPFQEAPGRQEEQKAWQHCCDQIKAPDASFPPPRSATAEVTAVIARAVKTDPAQRYQTATELANAYQAAISRLTEMQKAMILPYNVSAKEMSLDEKVYLSTGRTTYGADSVDAALVAPALGKEKARSDSAGGFVIPEKEAAKEEQKPNVPIVPKPNPNRLPLPLMIGGAVLAVTVVVLALLLILRPASIQYQVEPAMFSAEITLTNAPKDAQILVIVRAAGSERGTETTSSGGQISIEGLAPGTAYEVDVEVNGQSKTISLETKSAADGRFQPVRQRLYTCKTHLLNQRAADELEEKNLLTEVAEQRLSLRNAPLSEQNLAVLFSCLAQTEQADYLQQSTMYTVLRVPGKAVLVQQKTVEALNLTDTYFRCLEDVSGLFDMYYTLYGSQPEGQVRLELYWLDELVGSTELMLNTAGGS